MGFYIVVQDLLEGCSVTSLTEAGKISGRQPLSSVSKLLIPI